MEKTEKKFNVGDLVGYDCIPSLMEYRGKVVEVKPGKMLNGGDCIVSWFLGGNVSLSTLSEECFSSLRLL